MKKIINFLGILGIAAASCTIAYRCSLETPAFEMKASAQDFPLNQARVVNFNTEQASFKSLSDREQKDQLRDWLLFTVVSNKGLSSDQLNLSLYDIPTIRNGYMKPVSNFEYGETRSLYIGNGQVVALLPKDRSSPERMDDLAHIADKHRKDTGKIPTQIEVFEYEINQDQAFALLTRREVLDAQKFFTEGEHGYHEATINSLDDLERFMSQVDDVTFAQAKDSSLFLGGRKILSRNYQGIRVEDVAAIWQSEKKIQEELAEKLNALPPDQQEQTREEAGKLHSGFSLDPSYDYPGLKNFLVKVEPVLQQLASEDAAAIAQQYIENAKSGLDKEDILPYLQLADRLTKSDNPKVAGLGDFLSHQQRVVHSFQAARYDGDLQGTEVGMILFYTDLLAKLWGFNYQDATPEKDIQDFRPKTKIDVSSIYKQELKELPSTRTWFGPNDKGFQVADEGNSIIFARNATRIYAASSNPLQPGVEKATSAVSDIFLGWWNSHYEEVARYEPQYERLNEIMKWSLLISWLNKANKGETLEFLQGVQVKRDNWFPDWVQANGDRLTYKKWTQVGFYQRGYKGTKTEAMPILLTETFQIFGEPFNIYGGVSLASKDLFEGRAALPKTGEISELGLRSNLKYNEIEIPSIDNRLTLKTLDGTTYKLKNVEQGLSSVTAKAEAGVKFRSPDAELKNQKFSRKLSQTPSGIHIDTSIGDAALGSFSVKKTQNSFTVGFLGRDIDVGHSLGLRLSQSQEKLADAIEKMPDVQVAFMSGSQSPEYFVKMSGSKQWLKITEEPKPGGGGQGGGFDPPKPPDDWELLVGDLGDGSRNLRVSWIDDKQIQQQKKTGKLKEIKKNAANSSENQKVQEFAENLKKGRYDQVAQEITDKPAQFFVLKKKHLEIGLKNTDDLLKQGKNAKAALLIDDLIQVYGPEPNLMMRKALVELRESRLEVKQVFPNNSAEAKNFLDEINRQLERSNGKFNYSRIETDKDFFYVQDHPGLNNLDWNVPFEQSIPSGSGARVYQLHPGKIGAIPLDRSGLGDASASAHPSTQFRGSNINNALYNVVNRNNNECQERTEEENRQNPNCPQEKPTYVITMPENI